MPKHECFVRINERLAEDNARLAVGFVITESMSLQSRLLVATEKIDKSRRKAPPSVVASYCPFCGVKLEEASC